MDPTTNILKRSRQDAFDSDTAPAPKPEESAVKLESNTDNTTAAPESPPPVKTPSKTKPKATPKSKSSNKGRHGDPRMHRAVAARLMNPELSLLEALIEGGFKFPEGTEGTGKSDRNILDADGVLLCQRKNQLSRRLRLAKKRQLVTRGDGPNIPPAANVTPQDGDSRTLQNMLLNGQVPIAGSEMPAFASRQLAPSMYAQQPNVLDNVAHSANDPHPKRQFTESNLDQYLQMTVRSMGLRPEQFQQFQQFNNFPNNAMMAGFVGNTNPFQNYASLAAQQQQPNLPPNILAAMEQQQQLGNGVMDNTAGTAMNMNMNMQNNPMAAMMNMQQHPQQQLNASDLSRMLLNRSILMNNMDPQVQSEKV